jgi:hypothetical protein
MRHIFTLFILLLLFLYSCQRSKVQSDKEKPLISSCKIYTYDFEFSDENNPGQLLQEFRFNKQGLVNELIRYGIQGEVVSRFDITGNSNPFPMSDKPQYIDTVLTIVDLDPVGNVRQKEIKKYNTKGLIVSVEIFANRDSLISRNTYTYNKQGLIAEDIYWDLDLQKPRQVIRYKYEYAKK